MRWVVVLSKFFDQGPNLTKNLPSISTQCFPRVTRAAKLSAGVEPWSLNLSNVTVTLVRDNFGTTLRHLLGNLKTTKRQLGDNLETSLKRLWSMGPLFVNCYCDLETTWGRLWHNFVSTCKRLEDNLEPCMGPQFVNYHYVLLTIPTKPHIFWFWKHLPCAKVVRSKCGRNIVLYILYRF